MKKKLRAALLALMMVTALGTQAFAAQTARTYDFTFTPPYVGSWTKTSGCYNPVNGYRPYVSPSTSSARTVYYLLPKEVYDGGDVIPSATNYLTTGAKGKQYFKYNSGYGGTGYKYYLAARPEDPDFLNYRIKGTWAP